MRQEMTRNWQFNGANLVGLMLVDENECSQVQFRWFPDMLD